MSRSPAINNLCAHFLDLAPKNITAPEIEECMGRFLQSRTIVFTGSVLQRISGNQLRVGSGSKPQIKLFSHCWTFLC
jgi:hypothetical protein